MPADPNAVNAGWDPASGDAPYKHGAEPDDATLKNTKTALRKLKEVEAQTGGVWPEVLSEMSLAIGFEDHGNDNNPWGPAQGAGNHAAYCCSFACMVAFHHGYHWWPESQFGLKGDAYVPWHRTHAMAHGEWQADLTSRGHPADLQPGDQVVFVWPGGDGAGDHIETVVTTYNDLSYETIGANTGRPKGVWRVRRDRRYLLGRIRPIHYYDAAPPAPPPPPPIPSPTTDWTEELIMSLPTLDFRQAGTAAVHHGLVDNIQGLLKATQRSDCDPGAIDGVGGGQTRQAILNFQRIAGLSVDAVVGKDTWTKLIQW